MRESLSKSLGRWDARKLDLPVAGHRVQAAKLNAALSKVCVLGCGAALFNVPDHTLPSMAIEVALQA